MTQGNRGRVDLRGLTWVECVILASPPPDWGRADELQFRLLNDLPLTGPLPRPTMVGPTLEVRPWRR